MFFRCKTIARCRCFDEVTVTPLRVPHRDEFSETVGYRIEGPKRMHCHPDIDKWSMWDHSLTQELASVDCVCGRDLLRRS